MYQAPDPLFSRYRLSMSQLAAMLVLLALALLACAAFFYARSARKIGTVPVPTPAIRRIEMHEDDNVIMVE